MSNALETHAVRLPGNLGRLESEVVHIIREALTEARKPVLLFSGGKDSTVLAALAVRAFAPGPPPIPLLHVDSTFEFDETLAFRDRFAERFGFQLFVEANEDGRRQGINPFTHGSAVYTDVMRTHALKEAIDRHGFDVILGGARRDEEKTRAKERVFSIRSENHGWDPRNQRPELWALYNGRLRKGQTVRVFPLSNWTEADIWTYIAVRGLPIAPLYFAAERRTVDHEGTILVVNDDRYPWQIGQTPVPRKVRFRTVGCWPVTGAIQSDATTLAMVLAETLAASTSERQGRLIDRDEGGSLEHKKREGYF
ncbi:sulfate adenylyltransferase subunit CysD [Prosthecomicrobium hirschii]|uniref:sulfate adenylyltransferase subunit CysD n=1 Tax=Prosthecodimorpha hirschii TaxID=665126 RepID=UPI00221E5388|nr:sulfate adenylyltransferase subunit CysD [Prosthecomicrobium hirschii]MCW1842253.1 sulfate adenylyltransferase subunit CysD [Prosthecomicrobium hirschii]